MSSICIIGACGSKKTEEESKSNASNIVSLNAVQLKNTNIEIGTFSNHTISSTLKVNGKIDVPPQNMISISMPSGGYLKATKLIPGMHVTKGEVIATLEDAQYIQLQQDYLTTKIKLEFAEKEYNRQHELNQNQASSDKVFQNATSEYQMLKITLSALNEKLKLINIVASLLTENNITRTVNIKSPINGFVTKVNVNIGKYVSPSDIIFELIDPSDIHLNIKIFEKDLHKIAIGQKVSAYTNMQSNIKHTCTIILISKDLSEDHTADVHCHFQDYDKNLVPGMYMNADIELQNNHSMTLTADAIVHSEGKDYIFTQKNENNSKEHQYEMVAIKTGVEENGNIEVLDAANLLNRKIVVKGAYTLLMQLKNTAE